MLVCHLRKTLEDPLEVGIGIVSFTANIFDKGVDDSATPSCVLTTNEEPVLCSELQWSHCILHNIVVEIEATITESTNELTPLIQSILDRLS